MLGFASVPHLLSRTSSNLAPPVPAADRCSLDLMSVPKRAQTRLPTVVRCPGTGTAPAFAGSLLGSFGAVPGTVHSLRAAPLHEPVPSLPVDWGRSQNRLSVCCLAVRLAIRVPCDSACSSKPKLRSSKGQ